MTALHGHGGAVEAFTAAMASGALHHAWLIVGQEGIGKATFAKAMARELVGGGVQRDDLIAARSHPDYKLVVREVWDKSNPPRIVPYDQRDDKSDVARTIRVAQMRMLQAALTVRPSLGSRRAIVIDSADELDTPHAANALLKSLEEPPEGTTFFLVSHAPGRLLPTIRSRCRLLRFEHLSEGEVATVIGGLKPELADAELTALAAASGGSPGRGLRYAGLDVAGLDAALAGIAQDGDPANRRRSQLAKTLAVKAAQPRYELFLDRAIGFVANAARARTGPALAIALDAHAAARDLAGAALGLSLDAAATVFEMAGIVARLHTAEASPSRR